jgi:hypothetical protein
LFGLLRFLALIPASQIISDDVRFFNWAYAMIINSWFFKLTPSVHCSVVDPRIYPTAFIVIISLCYLFFDRPFRREKYLFIFPVGKVTDCETKILANGNEDCRTHCKTTKTGSLVSRGLRWFIELT